MDNPFAATPDLSPEVEAQAAALFGGLGAEELSEGASDVIHVSMLAALAAAGRAVSSPRRYALAGSALVAPLLLVGAASAATGESPLGVPETVLDAASSAISIGGNSGEVRQDIEVRSEAAGDAGQPGSQPGRTENAPGLNGDTDDHEETPAAPEEGAEEGTGDGVAAPATAPEEKLPPHENGKGCDDVLFANGEPPFASPGGPVGCEVGNSGDHRKNGAADDDEEPSQGPDDAAAEDDAEEDEAAGGTSRGLGNGHAEDRPGNGNANGHDKHGHDPNPNGHGPGGPADDDEEGTEAPEAPTASGGAEPAHTSPGKSGSAPGKKK